MLDFSDEALDDPFALYPEPQIIEGEGLRFTINKYGYIENLNKLLVPNLTTVQRRFIEQYLLLPRENPNSTLDVQEIDRFFFHAYRLNGKDIIFKTGDRVKLKIGLYTFCISQKELKEEDMTIFANTVYDNPNASVLLSGPNDLDMGFYIKVGKMREVDHVGREEFGDIISYRVNITPCLVSGVRGYEATCRIFRSEPPSFEDINVEPYIQRAIWQKDGMIWFGGATGQGKSSTISSCIHEMIRVQNPKYFKVAIYEQPIEQTYDKVIEKYNSDVIVSLSEVPFYLETFSQCARNALRRALDVAVVGESRDYATISTSLAFAKQGGLVFTTIHANNSISEMIERIVNLLEDDNGSSVKLFDIIRSTRLMVIQRLEPSPKGGMVAVREMLEFTPSIIRKLINMKNTQEVANAMYSIVKEHGISMSQSAQKLYDQGLLTEESLSYYKKLDAEFEEALA